MPSFRDRSNGRRGGDSPRNPDRGLNYLGSSVRDSQRVEPVDHRRTIHIAATVLPPNVRRAGDEALSGGHRSPRPEHGSSRHGSARHESSRARRTPETSRRTGGGSGKLPTLEETLRKHLVPATADGVCVICTEPYNRAEHNPVACRTNHNCKHVFGRSCWVKWLTSKREASDKCPVCRSALFRIDNDTIVRDEMNLDGIVPAEQFMWEEFGMARRGQQPPPSAGPPGNHFQDSRWADSPSIAHPTRASSPRSAAFGGATPPSPRRGPIDYSTLSDDMLEVLRMVDITLGCERRAPSPSPAFDREDFRRRFPPSTNARRPRDHSDIDDEMAEALRLHATLREFRGRSPSLAFGREDFRRGLPPSTNSTRPCDHSNIDDEMAETLRRLDATLRECRERSPSPGYSSRRGDYDDYY